MRLCLDMCDVDFQLKVKNWTPYDPTDFCSDKWTQTEFRLKGKYIDYSMNDAEIFLSSEVVYLKNALTALLCGEVKEDCSVSFAEPDFIFRIYPAKRLYSEPGRVSYRNGYRDVDLYLDMIVQFWCKEGLGSNYFSMTFDRQEVIALNTYLQLVTGTIAIDTPEVRAMLERGYFLPD